MREIVWNGDARFYSFKIAIELFPKINISYKISIDISTHTQKKKNEMQHFEGVNDERFNH